MCSAHIAGAVCSANKQMKRNELKSGESFPLCQIWRSHTSQAKRLHVRSTLHICVSKYFIAYSSIFSTAINASLGTDTVPKVRMRFLPSFCFSSSFFFRVMSPP